MAIADETQVREPETGVEELKKRTRSDILYSYRPSFVEGMARIFDFFGQMPVRRCRDSSPQAAWNALRGDWETIGADLWKVTRDFEAEHNLDVLGSWEKERAKRG